MNINIKFYILAITLFFTQSVFAQSPIHVTVDRGVTLEIYSNRYVINYTSTGHTVEIDTLISLGVNQEIINECPGCLVLPMNVEHYFSRIEFLSGEYDAIDSTGYPALPVRGLNLQLPEDASNIQVAVSNVITSRVNLQYPYIPSLPISLSSDYYSIVQQRRYYGSNGVGFFGNWCEVSDTYGFMGTTGVACNIFPFRYNPAGGYGDIIQSATFTVSFNSNYSLQRMFSEYTSGLHFNDAGTFYDTYRGETIPDPPYKGNYVILTHNDYVAALSDFIAHKQSIGYNVRVYKVPNDIAADSRLIRLKMRTLYCCEETRPRFLLLVGNTTQIPYSRGSAQSTADPPTDIYYACIEKSTGDMRKEDMAPEIYVGRWSVYDTTEVRYITQKTIKTELALYNTTKTDRHASLFSGTGKYEYWFKKDVKWIRDKVFNPTGIPNTVFIGSNTSTQSQMADELNGLNGHNPFLFHYSGHGNSIKIEKPWDVYYSAFNSTGDIQNSHLPYQPFGFGFACLLNDYSINGTILLDSIRQYNFGEGWTTMSNNGGVTFFGATTVSYSDQNKYSLGKVFRYFKVNTNYNIAQITAGGMAKHYSLCKVIARRRQVEKYNLLGDPSALIYGVSRGNSAPPKHNYENLNNGDITVYPTLVNDVINIEASPNINITSIYLYDMVGRMLELFGAESSMINVSHIQNGAYILQIKYNDNQKCTTKIIINH